MTDLADACALITYYAGEQDMSAEALTAMDRSDVLVNRPVSAGGRSA